MSLSYRKSLTGNLPTRFCLLILALLALSPLGHAEETVTDQSGGAISIASFNIQVFGKAKASKPEIMRILADTISRFDIVAIQEIRDKSGTAIKRLEAAIDGLGSDYTVILGPRLGRTTSKEQYAFVYRTETIEPIGSAFNLFIQSLIVLSLLSFSIETVPGLSQNTIRILDSLEVIIVMIFTGEYLLRLVVADRKLRFVFSFYGLIDLFAILPFYVARGSTCVL